MQRGTLGPADGRVVRTHGQEPLDLRDIPAVRRVQQRRPVVLEEANE